MLRQERGPPREIDAELVEDIKTGAPTGGIYYACHVTKETSAERRHGSRRSIRTPALCLGMGCGHDCLLKVAVLRHLRDPEVRLL